MEEDINYFKEFIVSQNSAIGGLAAIIVGAMMSKAVAGLLIAIPLMYVIGVIIVAMFMSDSLLFQEKVRSRIKNAKADQMIKDLTRQLRSKVTNSHPNWDTFERMKKHCRRLQTKEGLSHQLDDTQLFSFKESLVAYLSMWSAIQSIKRTKEKTNWNDLERKIQEVDNQIASTKNIISKKRLQEARTEYIIMLERFEDLEPQIVSLEARMQAAAYSFEEVYQRLLSGQITSNEQMKEALERMQIEEEIEIGIDPLAKELSRKRRDKQRQSQQQHLK